MELDKKDKQCYVAPTVLVVAVKTKGVVCASNPDGTGNGFPGGWN